MNQLTKLFSYEGNQVTFKNEQGSTYVNATQMAKSFGKRPSKWLELPTTESFISELEAVRKSDRSKLIQTINGIGTWMHEDVALEFSRWLSPAFSIWCNDRIKELLSVGMTATPSAMEDMLSNPDLIIEMATKLKDLRSQVAERDNALLQSKEIIAKAMPKVAYCEEVLQSKTNITTNTIAQELGITAIKLNQILKEKGVQYKQGGKWLLVSKFRNKGYTESHTHTYTKSNGEKGTDIQTRWTELGRAFIHHLFKN
ncbi:phage antirepressor KilAC domain-containing protein [Sphingobacterium siyangense]|uniref:phage antirepressor KilAC domain-containing protein n=1 Tax=Sphingobacterium siyangense TaxID=459529 RepID=UPI003DA4AA05